MSYPTSPRRRQSFETLRRAFLQVEGLPFSDLLPSDQIRRAFVEADALFGQEDEDRYTPELTLWGFLSQALHTGVERSCNAAVERIRALCLALDLPAPGPDSGAYCRARAKLPEAVLQRLAYGLADAGREKGREKGTHLFVWVKEVRPLSSFRERFHTA